MYEKYLPQIEDQQISPSLEKLRMMYGITDRSQVLDDLSD